MRVINRHITFDNKSGKNEPAELYIEGDIADEKWYDEDVTPKSIRDALKEVEAGKNIDIHINSYGGSVFAGNAIFDILDSYKKKNKIKMDVYYNGIGASMATGIACVGDTIYANSNSMLMLHSPISVAAGNANDMRKAADTLDKAEKLLIKNYMRKFSGTEEQLKDILAAETWMTADEAMEWGLVDKIIEPIEMVASAKGIKIGNEVFGGEVFDEIKNRFKNIKPEKEDTKLDYDSKLMDYGIDEALFGSIGVPSDKLIEIADKVSGAVKPQTQDEPFIDKAQALEFLGCTDIDAKTLLDYAKFGMTQPDVTDIQNKADEYDKIVSSAKQTALTSALKAQGESYNESRMKKYLDVLTYDEIMEQTKAWDDEAKKVLNAGKRVSSPAADVGTGAQVTKTDNPENYKF